MGQPSPFRVGVCKGCLCNARLPTATAGWAAQARRSNILLPVAASWSMSISSTSLRNLPEEAVAAFEGAFRDVKRLEWSCWPLQYWIEALGPLLRASAQPVLFAESQPQPVYWRAKPCQLSYRFTSRMTFTRDLAICRLYICCKNARVDDA